MYQALQYGWTTLATSAAVVVVAAMTPPSIPVMLPATKLVPEVEAIPAVPKLPLYQ